MHMQVGFDLNHTKHYSSAESAQKHVEKALDGFIKAGICFNILVVTQRRGGLGTNAEDLRYIPLLSCWRGPAQAGVDPMRALVTAGRMGFVCFM